MLSQVPDALILDFFQRVSQLLQQNGPPTNHTLAEARQWVLQQQTDVLAPCVEKYNSTCGTNYTSLELKNRLGSLRTNAGEEVLKEMTKMEQEARIAVCRSVLYSQQCHSSSPELILQASGDLEHSRLMDYIGLVQTSITSIPQVEDYVVTGGPLFGTLEETELKSPQERLLRIQGLLARAVGWDPDYATREIKERFFGPKKSDYDPELQQSVCVLMEELSKVLTRASLNVSHLSDIDRGGVTRVVSVQHSEVKVHPELGTTHSPPKQQTMLLEEDQQNQLRIASQAAILQQELLATLFNMDEEERKLQLEEAEAASERFLRDVMTLPPGPERIQFLQSVDAHTSRLLAMHKLWTSMLEQNGGRPPTIADKR